PRCRAAPPPPASFPARRSSALPSALLLRTAPLEKGRHALVFVGGLEEEGLAELLDGLGAVAARDGIEGELGHADGEGGILRDLGGEQAGAVLGLALGGEVLDEADLVGLHARDDAARVDELLRLADSHQA